MEEELWWSRLLCSVSLPLRSCRRNILQLSFNFRSTWKVRIYNIPEIWGWGIQGRRKHRQKQRPTHWNQHSSSEKHDVTWRVKVKKRHPLRNKKRISSPWSLGQAWSSLVDAEIERKECRSQCHYRRIFKTHILASKLSILFVFSTFYSKVCLPES